MTRHDYAVLTLLVLFSHSKSVGPFRQISDVMRAVTLCHVPLTVTSDVSLTLTCYSNHTLRLVE